MKDPKYCLPLAAAAIALSVGGLIACPLGRMFGNESWFVPLGLSCAALALAGSAAMMMIRRATADRQAAERYFEKLCQFDVCDLSLDGDTETPLPLPDDNPWSRVAAKISGAFEQWRQRTRELRHTRTAWEIRSKRAVDHAERIGAILSGIAEPVIAIDDFNELLLANSAAEGLFNFNLRRTEQRAIGELLKCQKLVDLLTDTCQRKTATNRSNELEVVDGGGQSHWYRVSASKLQAGSGEPSDAESPSCGAVAVLRDIGDQKQIQKRNAEFVSAVSHEMKTPLAGIKAYVELLVDGDAEDEETREEFLEVINSQADRLKRLVDNLLNLARIEAGVVSVNKKSRSLNEILEEAVQVVQPAAEAKQIHLSAELSPLYLGVLADRDMLLQSAINLLSNAIKYTAEKGKVALKSRLVDDEVTFEVEDTGVGLSEEDCQRVFEKFYRVNKDKNMAAGTGLGLPLAKHIVEDVHGGRLWVESTPNVGSRFRVALPKAEQMA